MECTLTIKEVNLLDSKIALVTPTTDSNRTAEETLALEYLASVLREKGHGVVVIDGWLRGIDSETIVEQIFKENVPDVICMSCYRSNLQRAMELLCKIKQRYKDIPVICGGYGPTFHDQDFIDAGFDLAVRGEAEHIICQLIDRILSKNSLSTIHGITYKQNGIVVRTPVSKPITDLDLIPFPDRDEIRTTIKLKNPVHVCTSRGCRAHCSFCSIAAFNQFLPIKDRWRYRSIENIVDELQWLHSKFGVTHIKFVDDSFIEPPRDEFWAIRFADAIINKGIHIRFRTQVRADRLTIETVANLKRAGWFSTSVGIENAAASALRRMGKVADQNDNIRSLKWLQQAGIYVQMGMILFDYATTIEELRENYMFLKSQEWIVTKGIFTEMFAAEGTDITTKLRQKGVAGNKKRQQNYRYKILDPNARRAYQIIKLWHRSHAEIYDLAIDPITAPKVLPEEGYMRLHTVCRRLIVKDVEFLDSVLNHIETEDVIEDKEFVVWSIKEHVGFYGQMKTKAQDIYNDYGLMYNGILNPFVNYPDD